MRDIADPGSAAESSPSNSSPGTQRSGGRGESFDWSLLTNLSLSKPWFLAGGLNTDNVADAIRSTHAPIVDVSSGIEDAPGIKSLEKIAAFNAAVLRE